MHSASAFYCKREVRASLFYIYHLLINHSAYALNDKIDTVQSYIELYAYNTRWMEPVESNPGSIDK